MEQAEVEKRVEGLAPEQAKNVVCALVGHSRIVHVCFGYVHCGRCDAQIADTLAGATTLSSSVLIGHDCPTCRNNFTKLDWRDTFMCAGPFDPAKIQEQKGALAALQDFLKKRRSSTEGVIP